MKQPQKAEPITQRLCKGFVRYRQQVYRNCRYTFDPIVMTASNYDTFRANNHRIRQLYTRVVFTHSLTQTGLLLQGRYSPQTLEISKFPVEETFHSDRPQVSIADRVTVTNESCYVPHSSLQNPSQSSRSKSVTNLYVYCPRLHQGK